jgi:predicted ATPase
MLESLLLQDFKAHSRLELTKLPPIVVLVGQNNTGKSAVLHAIASPKHSFNLDPSIPIGSPRDAVRLGAQTGRIVLTYRDPHTRTVLQRTFTLDRANGTANVQNAVSAEGSTPDPQRVFYLSAFRSVPGTFGYRQFTRDVDPSGSSVGNILYQMLANGEPEYASVVDWLKKMSLGIKFVGTPTQVPGQGSIVPESYGAKVNIVLQGSGTAAVLPIIVQGVLCQAGDILLVEEPESHLHRAAVDVLWEFFGDCAKRGVQVIMTTHSLDVLASMSQRIEEGAIPGDSIIYHFQRGAGGQTKVEKRDPKVFRNIREIIKKDLADVA